MNQAQALYRLQEVDLAIIHAEQRIDAIEAQLADNAAVQAAKAEVNQAETTLSPLEKNMREVEHQIQSTKDKRSRTEQRLYSGSVKNPKELQDMQQEIDSLKRWNSELEDRLLEAMVAVEEARAELNTAQAKLNNVTTAAAEENKDLRAEKTELEADLVDYRAERHKIAEQITDDNLQLYDKMRPKKANRPLAKLTDEGNCAACGVRQNNAALQEIRETDTLSRCSNCQRILVDV